jgi:hypothetical protein
MTTQAKQESKFNREKFRDNTSSSSLKAADKSVENTIRTAREGHYAAFHQLEVGINKFALMPSHESIKQMMADITEEIANEPFVVSKQIFWLPREVEDKNEKGEVKKDKKGNAMMKTVNMPVFDARIHSDVKKDIVDVYINTFKKQLEEELGVGNDAEIAIKERMLHIFGKFSKNPNERVQGIVGKPSWIMYAEKIVGDQKTFGRLEIGKAVKMRINELIAIEEANQPIGSESNNPFTDIELRRAMTIKYNNKAEDAKLFYITEIDSDIDKDPKSPTYKQVKFYPLSDTQLEEFLEFPSLSSLYKNCYTKKDFDLAIAGLQLFDDKQEFGVFANQDFLDEAEMMRNLYPDPKAEATEEEKAELKEKEDNLFDSMDREEMKAYARQNKTGIMIHSKLLDEDLRKQLKEWDKLHNGSESESEVKEIVKEEAKTDIEEILDKRPTAAGIKTTDSKGQTAKERIEAIRKGKK